MNALHNGGSPRVFIRGVLINGLCEPLHGDLADLMKLQSDSNLTEGGADLVVLRTHLASGLFGGRAQIRVLIKNWEHLLFLKDQVTLGELLKGAEGQVGLLPIAGVHMVQELDQQGANLVVVGCQQFVESLSVEIAAPHGSPQRSGWIQSSVGP